MNDNNEHLDAKRDGEPIREPIQDASVLADTPLTGDNGEPLPTGFIESAPPSGRTQISGNAQISRNAQIYKRDLYEPAPILFDFGDGNGTVLARYWTNPGGILLGGVVAESAWKNIDRTVIIHPRARVGPNAAIGEGAIIGPHANIGAGSVIGPGVTVGDHAAIGPNTRVGCGTTIQADVHIGANNTIGDMTSVADDITIGDGNTIGAYTKFENAYSGIRTRIGNQTCIGDRTEVVDTYVEDEARIGANVVVARCEIRQKAEVLDHAKVFRSQVDRDAVVGVRADVQDTNVERYARVHYDAKYQGTRVAGHPTISQRFRACMDGMMSVMQGKDPLPHNIGTSNAVNGALRREIELGITQHSNLTIRDSLDAI